MPVVDAEPERDERPPGARSLRKICLDRTIKVMYDESTPFDMLAALPWKLQQDLWTQISADGLERINLQQQLDALPLMDREKCQGIDENADFIRRHPEDFGSIIIPERTEEAHFWSEFLQAADALQCRAADDTEVSDEDEVYLGKNSKDSLIRFSICAKFGYLRSRRDCSHVEHFRLEDLITSELISRRLEFLKDAPGCDLIEYDDYHYKWTHGDLSVTVSENFEEGSLGMWANFDGDRDSVRSAEVYLNALLSPIETQFWGHLRGRNAFAKRYLKLVKPAGTEASTQ
jgi:hypothetical protein